jgi:hypothetical protein
MTPDEIKILYESFARRWKPQEHEIRHWAAGLHDQAAESLHARRLMVVEELAHLEPLQAAYVTGKMALDRSYSRLGQYLRIAMFGEAVAGKVDKRAAFHVLPFETVR